MTAVIELGSGDPSQAHTARIKFTVRIAGVYTISVLIGEKYCECFSGEILFA